MFMLALNNVTTRSQIQHFFFTAQDFVRKQLDIIMQQPQSGQGTEPSITWSTYEGNGLGLWWPVICDT
jgi:hypothetical protein